MDSIVEISISPNNVDAKVRGIGVALINRKSAWLPFCFNARRWSTPNRCCSSATTKPRFWNCTVSCRSECVPIRMSIFPAAVSFRIRFFSAAGKPLYKTAIRVWYGPRISFKLWPCMHTLFLLLYVREIQIYLIVSSSSPLLPYHSKKRKRVL